MCFFFNNNKQLNISPRVGEAKVKEMCNVGSTEGRMRLPNQKCAVGWWLTVSSYLLWLNTAEGAAVNADYFVRGGTCWMFGYWTFTLWTSYLGLFGFDFMSHNRFVLLGPSQRTTTKLVLCENFLHMSLIVLLIFIN